MKQEQNIETTCFIRQYMRFTFVAYLLGAGHCSRDAIFEPSMGPSTIAKKKLWSWGQHLGTVRLHLGTFWLHESRPNSRQYGTKMACGGSLGAAFESQLVLSGLQGCLFGALWCFWSWVSRNRVVLWPQLRTVYGERMECIFVHTLYILCILNSPSCIQKAWALFIHIYICILVDPLTGVKCTFVNKNPCFTSQDK